jgi:ribosomal protein L20
MEGITMKDKEEIIDVECCITKVVYNDDVIKEWRRTYEEYRQLLKPNRKSVDEILKYIKSKYPVEENTSDRAKEVVEKNVLYNYYGRRLSESDKMSLSIVVLNVKNENNAVELYENQANEHIEFIEKMKKTIKDFEPYSYKSVPIVIGAERKSGYIFVEGSQKLSEEITMIKGLDSDELKNYYLVANYINVLKKYNKLNDIIK